ncbi:MAG TPA: hypothetical protein VMJ33_10865 [Gallionella sp.]|nr:hypothetical protein [Gallionella sp.]
MKIPLPAALLLALASGFSANGHAVTVKGMKNCGAWLRSHPEHAPPSQNTLADDAWLDGYLSGVAVARNIDFLKGVDEKVIHIWMNNYCSSHPSDLVGYAADALSVELVKRMR